LIHVIDYNSATTKQANVHLGFIGMVIDWLMHVIDYNSATT
jgi:hypothetical protein